MTTAMPRKAIKAGRPASAPSVELLTPRGIDLSVHRSTTTTADLLREADLVLGMAREHVRHAAVMASDVWPRIFTLKALVRAGETLGPRPAHETVASWLGRVHEGRTTAELLGSSPEDDVADPIGQPKSAYRRMVGEVDDLVERLVALLWPVELDRSHR